MDHFAGMDVSVKETSVCILDDAGKIVKEVKVASEPPALLKVLGNPAYRFKRIGLEAGPLSQWCAGHRADDAGGPLPSGACKDAPQSEIADAVDPSQTATVQGHCHRERSTRYFTQLRPQGRNGRKGEVRGPHPGACQKPTRSSRSGRTFAHRSAGAARTDRHPASPSTGHRAGR